MLFERHHAHAAFAFLYRQKDFFFPPRRFCATSKAGKVPFDQKTLILKLLPRTLHPRTMDTPEPPADPKRHAFFRTPPVPFAGAPRSVSMPAWRSVNDPPRECVVILIGGQQRIIYRAASHDSARCLHAYGSRGASALCGARDWQELVPPDEATCPACRGRLGRGSLMPGVH